MISGEFDCRITQLLRFLLQHDSSTFGMTFELPAIILLRPYCAMMKHQKRRFFFNLPKIRFL